MARGWAVALVLACHGDGSASPTGPAVCDRPSTVAALGCARVYGSVQSTLGVALDGIEGSIRPGASCPCPLVTLHVDDRGLFSGTVYRTSPGDTAQVTVVVQATAAKYPRHVTGAPYFDTAAVKLRFAPTGMAPVPLEVNLRIPLPR